MGRPPKLTPVDQDEIVVLRSRGVRCVTLARLFGVSERTIRRVAARRQPDDIDALLESLDAPCVRAPRRRSGWQRSAAWVEEADRATEW
jgi:hypothetical protein